MASVLVQAVAVYMRDNQACLSERKLSGLRSSAFPGQKAVNTGMFAKAKVAPLSQEKSSKRSLIVAEGVESAATSTTTTSSSSSSKSGQAVTIEYQRQRAKELQEYFADKKYEEETVKGRIFGWTRKNEITNGRWTMFGIAVGLLTEFATGADFVEQLKIIVSNLGIADVD